MMLFLLSLTLSAYAKPWTIQSPFGVKHPYPEQISPSEWLVTEPLPIEDIPPFDTKAFLQQCTNTYEYLKRNTSVPLGILAELGYTQESRIKAYETILKTQNNPSLLHDINWWHTHFQRVRIHDKTKENPSSIRITKYVVYQVQGSTEKTELFNHALWEITKGHPKESLYNHSRIDILAGALETQRHVHPLVWLSQNDALEAQMQGTVEVSFPDKSKKLYNVHLHNNMPYQKGIPATEQDRYWYFREVDFVYGWGTDEKVPIAKDFSFAGDIENFGFGTIMWIQSPERSQMGLLVDTGGAFQPNLGQFDWFIGSVRNKEHFYEKATEYPSYGTIDLLLLR